MVTAAPLTFTALERLDQQLRLAIEQKRLIDVTYKGHRRLAEPHDYGIMKGTLKVFVYQLEKAGSLRPGGPDWRWYDLPKIGDCTVSDRTFPGTRARPGQRHHVWDVLFARVK